MRVTDLLTEDSIAQQLYPVVLSRATCVTKRVIQMHIREALDACDQHMGACIRLYSIASHTVSWVPTTVLYIHPETVAPYQAAHGCSLKSRLYSPHARQNTSLSVFNAALHHGHTGNGGFCTALSSDTIGLSIRKCTRLYRLFCHYYTNLFARVNVCVERVHVIVTCGTNGAVKGCHYRDGNIMHSFHIKI
jgi:hypothetical protein